MSFNISAEQSYAYAEILEILSFLSKKFINKIPNNLINLFKKHASTSYENHLNKYEPLENQEVSDKTAALLTLIALNYWCETQDEVAGLRKTLAENDRILEEKRKASLNNLFDNNISSNNVENNTTLEKTEETTQEQTALVDCSKLPWYKKIFTMFKRKKQSVINK